MLTFKNTFHDSSSAERQIPDVPSQASATLIPIHWPPETSTQLVVQEQSDKRVKLIPPRCKYLPV